MAPKGNKNAVGNQGGRPTLYRDTHPERAYKLYMLGLTDEEVAVAFGVHRDTLFEWCHQHPEFSDASDAGKLPADSSVAVSLYKRAMGYSHEAVKIFMPQGADEPVYAPYVEHYPPDTPAASLWLRNRQPGKWRDRQELTGKDGEPFLAGFIQIPAKEPTK